MLLISIKKLVTSLALLLLASPLKASSTVASQPTSFSDLLQQSIPSCAQSCLRSSLADEFPVACTAQEDVYCLCSHYTNSGESLGEVAVGCVYSSCSSLDRINTAYGICLGRKDAVKPTKTALTYTVIAGSSSPGPTTMSSQTSFTSGIPLTTTANTSRLKLSQSASANTFSTLPSATVSAPSTAVPSAAVADASPSMTPAQIAGLSVAAVAAFILAIGLMALSVCLRRRGEQSVSMDRYEKGRGGASRIKPRRFSHYVALKDRSGSPARVPLKPTPVSPRNTSNLSLPLDQIGIAISAELHNPSVVSKPSTTPTSDANQPAANKAPPRPFSALTQETVFEEDDLTARRRSSVPLPPLPLSIPPIRNLQASRSPPPTYDPNHRQTARESELFLEIPVRNQQPKPPKFLSTTNTEDGSPQPRIPSLRPRLVPAIQTSSSKGSVANTASSRNPSNQGDRMDCYYSSNQHPTPKASPAHFTRPKDSPKTVQIKSKNSPSTVSHRSSHGSSHNNKNRDSLSSQTSFETDANDTTPEEDDPSKRLQLPCSTPPKQRLSPVAESPISSLRYPKVPRSTNQLVPRSPAKDASMPQKPSAHHVRDTFISPPCPQRRTHQRSTSAGATSAVALPPRSVDRGSRVRSGAWGASPVMYEEDVVRPLNVRRRGDYGPDRACARGGVEDKHPVWIPKLMATKGEDGDLWLRVGL